MAHVRRALFGARPSRMSSTRSRGVVAAGHELTAATAADILRQGGTAFDAAIAALAMSCVCEPILSSPGGGGFAMVRDGATGSTHLIDFFPQTPLERRMGADHDGVLQIHADFGTATQAFHIGPATVATPGFFHGLLALHARGATHSLIDLFGPAVRAARTGISISPFQHYLTTVVEPIVTNTAGTRSLFAPNGTLLQPGETFRNPGLADALESLALSGVGGQVDLAIVENQAQRGHVVAGDLEAYEAIERTPLAVDINGATVHLNPLPAASGTLIAHTLSHLESADAVDIARALLATSQARQSAGGDLSALASVPLRQRGTTHISVIDANRTACSVTISNGSGNGEVVDDFGFMLNNILGEEDVNPGGSGGWPTNTRLSSMMCPTMIEFSDGRVVALGSGGSNRIRSAICQVVISLCMSGVDLSAAVKAPRLHVEAGHLDFEDLYNESVRDELVALFADHRAWPERNMFYGGVHSVGMDSADGFAGCGDARRDGTAIVVE